MLGFGGRCCRVLFRHAMGRAERIRRAMLLLRVYLGAIPAVVCSWLSNDKRSGRLVERASPRSGAAGGFEICSTKIAEASGSFPGDVLPSWPGGSSHGRFR